jgi:hypothetical protein
MVERIYVYGDAKTCRKRVEEFFKAGVTTTALQFISFAQSREERGVRLIKALKDFANA